MSARALLGAGLLLALAACGGYPASPNEDDLSGTWIGSVPRQFYTDEMRLELVQSGRALGGQGVRGLPCPADGTCYAEVRVSGTVRGADVTVLFGPPFGDSFVAKRQANGDLAGTLPGYSDRPPLVLRRIRE